jgi:hypothetical protein
MKLPDEIAGHWFMLTLALRRRWWEETEYGKKEPPEQLKKDIAAWITQHDRSGKTTDQ